MATSSQVPVLIVGGGIVGFTASLCLSHHGIHSLLVERHASTSIHSRARSVNARTMELFRSLGLEELVKASGASLPRTTGIYHGHSLREVNERKPRTEGVRKIPFTKMFATFSPTLGTFITQDVLEPGFLEAAKQRGGDVRFYTECPNIEQNNDGVKATLRDR